MFTINIYAPLSVAIDKGGDKEKVINDEIVEESTMIKYGLYSQLFFETRKDSPALPCRMFVRRNQKMTIWKPLRRPETRIKSQFLHYNKVDLLIRKQYAS